MPVLTAYAQPPAHGAGWPSLTTTPAFSPASSCPGPLLAGPAPITPGRPRPSTNSSPAPRPKKSSSPDPPIVLANPSPRAIVRGILTKSSLAAAPTLIQAAPTLIIGATLVPPAAPPPLTKKVRFSGGAPPPGQPDGPVPVLETICLTYSRTAYDRSPIEVDRVLNKSLTLPARTDDSEGLICGGRWLAHLLPCPPADLPSSLEEEPKSLLLSGLAPSPAPLFVAANAPVDAQWLARPHPLARWLSEDDLSESTASSGSQDPATPALATLLSPLLPAVGPPSCDRPASLSVENLAHHALSNLALSHSSESCLQADPDPLCGFGNWTRAQLFDSCDALDGF